MTARIDTRTLVRRPLLVPTPLQRYLPGPTRTEQHEHALFSASGGAGNEANYVAVFGPIEPERLFVEAELFFDSADYSVIVESCAAAAVEDQLVRLGWIVDEDEPSLILTPIPQPPKSVTGLEIRPVASDAEFDHFMTISQTGRRWVPTLEAATDPRVCLLVGYWDGIAIATSRINILGDVGEINGVATDPAYRRRGFGTEMTWAAVAAGAKRGCAAIVLSASELGYPVYVRMGFVPVCNYRTYVRPAESLSTTSADEGRALTDS